MITTYWTRFLEGDRDAFGEIYKQYRPVLTFFCLGKLKDEQLAENCASEALIKTLNHKNPQVINDLNHWLFTLARNECITVLRKNKRHQSLVGQLEKNPHITENPGLQEDIDQIIKDRLESEEQKLWELHSSGYNNREIANQLGASEKTVANKKSEIRKKLKEALRGFNNQRE